MSGRHETLPALISAAERALATAGNFDEVKRIRDQAEGLRAFAKKIGADTRQLGIIKLRAEKRLGRELKQRPSAPGPRAKDKIGAAKVPIPKLADLGISKKQSSTWQRIADVPDQQFETYLATADEVTTGGLLKIVEPARKKQRRAEREKDLAAKTRAASKKLGVELCGVIYADPPWRLEPYSRESGLDRAADNHYPTMALDELKALQPKIPAGPNCALFLWATVPMLDQALALMTAWGFAYRSHWIWFKSKVAHGYWNRNKHELLLVGVKGEVPAPAPGEQYESVRQFAVGAHSAKPDIFAAMIEEMFPTVPRLEMFARRKRPGWQSWGNEVEP